MILPLLAALAIAAANPQRCNLQQLDACRTTNELIWAPDFVAALKRFFGSARGSYLENDRSIYSQALALLGGPPDDPKRLDGGLHLFTACQAHDCPEKGAVILSDRGMIMAVGLLTNHCHKVPAGQSSCELGPTLDVFVQHLGPQNKLYKDAFLTWAKPAADADQAVLGGIDGPFQGMEERSLADLPSKPAPRRSH